MTVIQHQQQDVLEPVLLDFFGWRKTSGVKGGDRNVSKYTSL
jgi:hypothetical protein